MNVAAPNLMEATDNAVLPEALAATLFRPMGLDGVYARTALFEGVIDKLAALISRHRHPEAETLRLPPVMSRRDLEKSGYLKSFPNLLGCVSSLHGTEAEINAALRTPDDWTKSLGATDLVLSPAACYPVYPLAAARGAVPDGGLIFDVACDCFRREPSTKLDRFQSFRMREYVRIGTPGEIERFRDTWMDRAIVLAERLGLTSTITPASDPFFGRTGQVRAVSQLQQSLKFELLIPVHSAEQPTACMSFNAHRDHFGTVWGIRTEDGEVAHSGCVAFGMDRLVLALFRQHGLDINAWPSSVRTALDL